MSTTIGLGSQTAMASGLSTYLATGALTIYDGTAPANAKAALSSNTVCATHTLAGFTESNGVLTANAIASVTISASSVGGVTFGRILISGVSQWQGIVGAEITVTPDVNYVSGGTSNVTSMTLTTPDA
jgi:hypothetical protein